MRIGFRFISEKLKSGGAQMPINIYGANTAGGTGVVGVSETHARSFTKLMQAEQLRKHVQIFLVALAMLALAAGSASADVILNFQELPNEGGIHLTGTAFDGTPIDVTKLGSEMFRVAAPMCSNAVAICNPDFTTSQIGTATEFLVNIFESAGGPLTLSDQIHVHRVSSADGSQVIDFISDPSAFDIPGPGAIVSTLVETGSLQSGLTYLNNAQTPVHISFSSEVSEVPEPGTLSLLGFGVAVLAFSRRESR
jgi:hypothetical protein